jgi:hypothetical protein
LDLEEDDFDFFVFFVGTTGSAPERGSNVGAGGGLGDNGEGGRE